MSFYAGGDNMGDMRDNVEASKATTNNDDNSHQHNQDHESMRRAFEQFMLQGKSSNKTNKSSFDPYTVQKQNEIEQQKRKEKELNRILQEMKKAERKYWTIFHKFCNILQSQWMDIDDQALEVIQSISGIRHRLPITMKLLKRYEDAIENIHRCDWKYQSYNQHLTSPSMQSESSLLHKEDVELALSHDLLQHEKMMQALRNLFANLSEMQEALSRTLDEIMKHHLDQESQIVHYQLNSSVQPMKSYLESASLVNLTTELFGMLSMELFRKQNMVQWIVKSADDGIFTSIHEEKMLSHDDDGSGVIGGPKKIVAYCLRRWSRSCQDSFVDNLLLEYAIKSHQKNHNSN